MNEKERMGKNMKNEERYVRFSFFHRMGHFLVMISFFGLVLTGMPLVFNDHAWARWIYNLMGGFPVAGIIHRIAALITFLAAFIHFLYLSYFIGIKREKGFLWGPDSLMPQPKDLSDIIGDIKWFLGMGYRPRFDRWIYWEKIEYLSLMWGTVVMAVSGLILWFPVQSTRLLPGLVTQFIDLPTIALIVHRYEAILAAIFVFTIHFIHTHLLPEKVPVDEAMFTGLVSGEELAHERALYFERLKGENKLEGLRSGRASCLGSFITKLVAIPALVIGLIVSSLMISGLLVLVI